MRDEPGQAVALAELGAQVLVLTAERAPGQRFIDPVIELVGLLSLLEVVERAEADRFLGRLPLRVRGEQNDLGFGRVGLGRSQDVEAIAIGHAQIGHDEIDDAVSPFPQQERQGAPRRRLVVHDQEMRHLR